MHDTTPGADETATERGGAVTSTTRGRVAALTDLGKRAAARVAAFTRGLPARRLALPFLIIGLLLGLRAFLAPAPMLSTSAVIGSAAPQVNHYAPDIALTDLSGKPVQLSSLRGEVVMLAFWSTSCSTCQSDLQALERAYQQEQAAGFVVVGLDASDNGPSAATYAKHAGMTYPIFVDDSGRDTAIYHVTKTPSSFLIDRFGVIRAIFIGPVDNATLVRDLAQLLREK